jgi:serine/threonine protein kinase
MLRQPQLEITLEDVIENGHETYLSISSQGLVRRYLQEYVVKIRDTAEQTRRELRFLEIAGECAVDVVGIVNRWSPPSLIGFIMPLERVIDPAALSTNEKIAIFEQMKTIVPELHRKGIIHGDITLSNMLLNAEDKLVLCDFGTSAFVDEVHYPSAISSRWCSPYRLESQPPNSRRLVVEEDIYGLRIAVWELFTGKVPFEEIDDDDNEIDVEDVIRRGETVDVPLVENLDARDFIKQCLAIFAEREENSGK